MLDVRPTVVTGVAVPLYTMATHEFPALSAEKAGKRPRQTHAVATREAAARIRDEVLKLDRLVDTYRAQNSSLGYFAAVYREMTASVWRCLEPCSGQRQVVYPTLMADFIQLFAKRYTDALAAPDSATESWQLAFAAADSPLVVHLLSSMNAHIRLDLGLALAAATRTETTCQLFRKDFDIINKLVSGYDPTNDLMGVSTPPGMVHNVAETLRRASPSTALFDGVLGGWLRQALADRIVLERVHVVDVAEAGIAALQSRRPGAWRELEQKRDAQVARAGRLLLARSRWSSTLHKAVRWFERSPAEIIDALRPPSHSLVPLSTSASPSSLPR
ncbi:MAG: hypothetical protein JWN04_363 [Myxococcaceae bacterium]|nr:hypothetical protein [Myxococcaceae bacterium]